MSGSALAQLPELQATDRGDLLSLSFADLRAGVCGQVRVNVLPGGGRQMLAAVFEADRVVTAQAVPDGTVVLSGGIAGRWSARFDGGAGGDGAFALELESVGPPAPLRDPQYEAEPGDSAQQLCAVTGTVRLAGRDIALTASGQAGLVRGAADWSRRELWREIDCWLGADQALTVRASRPIGTGEHGGELVGAVLIAGEPAIAAPIDETRVSTIYDRDGHLRQAGLELWATEDSDYPRRLAGEKLCAATVLAPGAGDQPDLRWDCAFLRWHMEGLEGVGPYNILRRQEG